MKKIGDLMKEAGFAPHSSQGVKEAYIKHLIRVSQGVFVATPSEKKEMAENPARVLPMKPEQLSFDFADEKTSPPQKNKKIAGA